MAWAQPPGRRRDVSCGLESDHCYYFLPEKLAQDSAAWERRSDDIADYPNPDLAIEVDDTPPQVDRAGIYAALRVAEVWRFDGDQLVIERLTPAGTYAAVDASGFLPVQAARGTALDHREGLARRYELGPAAAG